MGIEAKDVPPLPLRPWLALATALALPLAGCTTPAAPPALPLAAADSPPELPALPLGMVQALLPPGTTCPVPSAPQELATEEGVQHFVWGCVLLAADLDVRRPQLPGAVVEVEVPEGAALLTVVFHLHGPEPVRAILRDPASIPHAEGTAEGDADRDSVVELAWPDPAPGTWTLRAEILERLSAAAGWSALAEVVLAPQSAPAP